MKPVRTSRDHSGRTGERGYAMLLALGLIMVLLISSTALVANLRIEGKRQREDETIWRGQQYARAIRLYFHKTGHYPQTVEDLKKGMPQLHFLRQEYKDPMNKSDGSWRFIYVNAAGQIIGSTKYTSLQQMALVDSGGLMPGQGGQIPGQPGIPVSSLTNSSGFGSATGDTSSGSSNSAGATGSTTGAQNPPSAPTDPNALPPPPGQAPDPSGQNPQGQQPPAAPGTPPSGIGGTGIGSPGAQSPFGTLNGQTGNPIDQQKPTGPVDGPVLGAFMTGVACKLDAPSQKVYHHGKKYLEWEFIWNPLEEAAANLNQSLNGQGGSTGIGQPISPTSLGPPINSPFGSPPGTPQPQQPMPQQQ
ncbi:MAG: hypothetical protein ACRD59_04430 [Candidatus Acidiferrales bacterium]